MACTLTSVALCHRAGLNRGVPVGRSIQIMGGSFRRGLQLDLTRCSALAPIQN